MSVLEPLVAIRGAPWAVRGDNRPELVSAAPSDRAERRGVAPRHIQPGKPNPNAYIERFNRAYRREAFEACRFASLADVGVETGAWLTTYGTERPHDSPGDVPPLTFLPRPTATPTSPALNCPRDGGADGPARRAAAVHPHARRLAQPDRALVDAREGARPERSPRRDGRREAEGAFREAPAYRTAHRHPFTWRKQPQHQPAPVLADRLTRTAR